MENKIIPPKKVLLDGDVISHFIKGELFDLLPKLYPHRLIILDIVKTEIYQRRSWNIIIDKLINKHKIEEITFPEDIEYKKEFAHLISIYGLGLGRGESACLVYCKLNKNILASSNLKDIQKYCSFHNIEYITTTDILYEGYQRQFVSEADCNLFISKVKSQGSKIPFGTMKELIAKKKNC